MNAHHHIHDAIPDDARGLASPAELAEAAAEAVRSLNHATIRGGYVWPSDVAAVLAELLLLTERLPQALEQAWGWLDDQAAAGRVGHDNDPIHPTCSGAADLAGVTVGEVSRALQDAQAPLARLAQSLQDARNAASHLTGQPARPGHDTRHDETPDAETADGDTLGGGVR